MLTGTWWSPPFLSLSPSPPKGLRCLLFLLNFVVLLDTPLGKPILPHGVSVLMCTHDSQQSKCFSQKVPPSLRYHFLKNRLSIRGTARPPDPGHGISFTLMLSKSSVQTQQRPSGQTHMGCSQGLGAVLTMLSMIYSTSKTTLWNRSTCSNVKGGNLSTLETVVIGPRWHSWVNSGFKSRPCDAKAHSHGPGAASANWNCWAEKAMC